jgi:hypothetical protein
MRRFGAVIAVALLAGRANASDQTRPGAGNAQAVKIARSSPLVAAAFQATRERARQIEGRALREATVDALYRSRGAGMSALAQTFFSPPPGKKRFRISSNAVLSIGLER